MKRKRIIQALFFIAFSLLLHRHIFEHLPGYIIALSPSVHLGNVVALIMGTSSWLLVVPSLMLIGIGIEWGRLFCFYACPLGFIQDCLPSLKKDASWLGQGGRSNIIFFLFLFILSLFSINTLGLFDPLVIFARIVNGVIAPLPRYYIWFFVLFIIIIGLHSVSKRLWCFYVCPLGAVFDGCRMIRKKRAQQPVASSVNTMRRTVLKTLLGSVVVGLGLRSTRSSYAQKDLIRPPGARREEWFKRMCIRCGNCVRACITGGLQPTLFESGWDGMFTPRLVPRIGECDEYCNRCGRACPTAALEALPLSQKRNLQLGIADVDRSNCLGWNGEQLCFICGEYCPYLAIERYMKDETIPCPVIKKDVCRGCGLCEKQCPMHTIRIYRS